MRVCRIKKSCLLSPRVAPKLRVGSTVKGQRGLWERVCPETNSTIKRHGHEISYQMLYALKRTLEPRHHIMVETSSVKRFKRISTLFLHFLFQSIQRFLCSTWFGNAEIPPGTNKSSKAEQTQRAFEFSIHHSLQRTVIEKHTIINRRPETQKALAVRDTSTVTARFSLAGKGSKVGNQEMNKTIFTSPTYFFGWRVGSLWWNQQYGKGKNMHDIFFKQDKLKP